MVYGTQPHHTKLVTTSQPQIPYPQHPRQAHHVQTRPVGNRQQTTTDSGYPNSNRGVLEIWGRANSSGLVGDVGVSDDHDDSMVYMGCDDDIFEYDDDDGGADESDVSEHEEQGNWKKGKRKKTDSQKNESESRRRGGSKQGKHVSSMTAENSRRKIG